MTVYWDAVNNRLARVEHLSELPGVKQREQVIGDREAELQRQWEEEENEFKKQAERTQP